MVTLDNAIELLEETANLLRGMTMDPSIPKHTKEAMFHRIVEIDALCEQWDKEN